MLQRQVESIEKQRNYLMKKLQNTKNNMETDKFRVLKNFEMEKLDLLKKVEELLVLNDVLAGQRIVYDMGGHKIDTQEILDMLNPFQFLKDNMNSGSLFCIYLNFRSSWNRKNGTGF